jgi:peptidoglycan/LPS O-acetylase OafA/YrhL
MKSVLQRVSPETRRRTGWIIPLVMGCVLGPFFEGSETVLTQPDRLWSSALAVAGFVAGGLWQWYSPRDLVDRLVFPAGAIMALALLFTVPGEWSQNGSGYSYWFPFGVLAGLVLAARWQRDRKGTSAETSTGTGARGNDA